MAPLQTTLFRQALTTPFNRYSSSNRFPLLELGIGAITPVVLTRVVAVVDDAMVLIQYNYDDDVCERDLVCRVFYL